jgi:hypothetical protein
MSDDDLYTEWRQHLTPELRRKFERKGAEIVQAEVGSYGAMSKRQAAQVWLAEERSRQISLETRRFWIITVLAAGSLVAGVVAIFV